MATKKAVKKAAKKAAKRASKKGPKPPANVDAIVGTGAPKQIKIVGQDQELWASKVGDWLEKVAATGDPIKITVVCVEVGIGH